MKRKIFLAIFLFLFLVKSHVVNGQFTPAEIAQREELEKFLKNAEIVKSKEVGEGVTRPYKLDLKIGEVEHSGCWKNPKGIQKGSLEGWQYEIAAYKMDKLLGLNLVPPTVERKFKGKKGSLQFWCGVTNDLDRIEKGIRIPQPELINWNKQKYLARAFDCLIANEDRTQQNIRYFEDWRTILIDHSRSFRSSKKFTENLVYGKNGILAVKLFRQLPRAFVEKIKALTFDSIKEAVGPYLKEKEIRAILARKKILLKEIDERIKEKGENKFYIKGGKR